MKNKKIISAQEIDSFAERKFKFTSASSKNSNYYADNFIKDDGKVHLSYKLKDAEGHDFIDSLEKQIEPFRFTLPIVLDIYAPSDSSVTNESIEGSISRFYQIKYSDSLKKLRKDNFVAWILLAVGIVIMGLYITLCIIDKAVILREVISIFSWVFIWEFFDRICFDFPKRKESMQKLVQLGTIEVNIIKVELWEF